MNDYRLITKVTVRDSTLKQTREWLLNAGKMGNETFVLWAGVFRTVSNFAVTTAILPQQRFLRSPNGVGVYVEGQELFRVSKWLLNNKLVLLAQVHSHPTHAFHSDTDDNFPLVTTRGQFSVVVPFFARQPLDNLSNCAVFRLSAVGSWTLILRKDVDKIFEVIPGGCC